MSKAYLTAVMMLGVAALAPRAQAQTRTLPSGTKVVATLDNEISSASTKIGDTIVATINSDVKDNAGQVIFPVGSKASVKVIDIKGVDAQHRDGTLALAVTSVNASGQTYHLNTAIDSMGVDQQKPGWTSDKKKIGIGAAAGAVLGGLLGGNLKSAVIGGVLGAAGGATVAHETNGNDIIVKSGTNVTFQLQQSVPVMVSSR